MLFMAGFKGTTTQLCEYLLEKHPAMRAAMLPMRGQARVVYLLDYSDAQGAADDPETIAVKIELRELFESGGGRREKEDGCHQHH